MSYPEVLLWQRIRGQECGVKFRRQHPVGPYVVDFYCAALKLAIEVDGISHDMGARPGHDMARTASLEASGITVLRIPAAEILADADSVAASIAAPVASPLHHPADGPPPRAGEDQE